MTQQTRMCGFCPLTLPDLGFLVLQLFVINVAGISPSDTEVMKEYLRRSTLFRFIEYLNFIAWERFFWRWITRVLSLYLAWAFNWCTKPVRCRTNKAYPWIGYQLNTLFLKVWHCWSCITFTHALVQPNCKIVLYDCVGIVLEHYVGYFRVVLLQHYSVESVNGPHAYWH